MLTFEHGVIVGLFIAFEYWFMFRFGKSIFQSDKEAADTEGVAGVRSNVLLEDERSETENKRQEGGSTRPLEASKRASNEKYERRSSPKEEI